MKFSAITKAVYTFSASSQATLVSIAFVVIWLISGYFFHYSDTWQLIINSVSAVITFIMVFVINNAQKRDTDAINAKLDALILANQNIDNMLISLEDNSDEDVFEIRSDIRNKASGADET